MVMTVSRPSGIDKQHCWFYVRGVSSNSSNPMTTPIERAIRFRDLHTAARPLQLANAWDATSARVLAAAGAPAIGTTSFGVALDHGVWDGELLPFDEVLAVAASIVAAVDVPVIDRPRGRPGRHPGRRPARRSPPSSPAAPSASTSKTAVPGHPAPAARRRRASRAHRRGRAAAADASGIPIFVNARCDVWFGADVSPTTPASTRPLLRSTAYQAAGADGLFLPGLLDVAHHHAMSPGRCELPVNIMVGIGAPSLDELAAAGVRRLSQGGEPFLAVVGTLKTLTERYLAGELGATRRGRRRGRVAHPGADGMSAARSTPRRHLTTPDGCRLAYLAEGTGPTVVFAHGGLTRGSGWIGVTALLRDTFTCVMLDQRGPRRQRLGRRPAASSGRPTTCRSSSSTSVPCTRWSATPTARWSRSKRPGRHRAA